MMSEKPETRQGGTLKGYRVQARVSRFNATNPIKFLQPHYGDQPLYLTETWVDIHFHDTNHPAGCPKPKEVFLNAAYLLEKKSAVALAYTFAAQHGNYSDVEVRVRGYEVKYNMEYGPTEEIIPLSDHLSDFEKKMGEVRDDKTDKTPTPKTTKRG